jgi:hypothetical protein
MPMSHRITLPSLLTGLIAVAALAACGSSSTTSSSSGTSSSSAATAAGSTAPTSAPATSAAAISTGSCPSASTVGGALGVTLPTPTVVTPGAGATPLPGGAAGIACSYISAASATSSVVVIIALASGLPSSYFSTEEQKQVASLQAANLSINFTPVSGVGDEAASYQYTANGATVEGVLAGQGGNFAGVFTEGTSASLSQIESLVKQLL